MKKKKTRLIVCVLSFVIAAVSMTGLFGCGGTDSEQIDSSRTQLYVATYGGGYGTSYLKDLKTRFEEAYKDVEFEPGTGKKGVQVLYKEDKDKYMAETLVTSIAYDDNEVFHLSGDALNDFLSGGEPKILELTDIVTEKLTEFGETRSIEDKLRDAQKAYYKRDSKYYALPFIETTLGIIYDEEVFEENTLYIAKNGAPSERLQDGGSFSGQYKWTKTGEKSAGPDGQYGTYDDGFPATLEEFEQLINQMRKMGVKSLIWTGQFGDTYTSFLTRAFHVNYHGTDEFSILYDAGGSTGRDTRLVTGFSSDATPIIETVNVGNDNIADLAKQAGYYYGLKMYEIILNSGTVSDYSWQDLTQVRTQERFLASNRELGEEPIAMMIEGTWWEQEAESSGIFSDHEKEFENASREERRFGLFPMPNATEEDIGKQTILGGGGSMVVKAGLSPEKEALAKLFVQFSLTDESLKRFTSITSLPMGYIYEMDETDMKNMTYFGKQYWTVYSSSDVAYEYIPKEQASNGKLLTLQQNLMYLRSENPSGTSYSLFPTEVHYNNVSLKDFFEGLARYNV